MEKYLRLYAEPETAAIRGLSGWLGEQPRWENVMVIPACNETDGCLRPPPPCGGRSLVILVINESESASQNVSFNNHALAAAVFDRFDLRWQSAGDFPEFGLSLFEDPLHPRDILLVDRFG